MTIAGRRSTKKEISARWVLSSSRNGDSLVLVLLTSEVVHTMLGNRNHFVNIASPAIAAFKSMQEFIKCTIMQIQQPGPSKSLVMGANPHDMVSHAMDILYMLLH
jgi:hypothetical protein